MAISSAFVTVLIAVWGASPGVGKSTLCASLCAQLADAGLQVDHFRAIATFIADLAEILAPVGPVLVYLDGSAETGLPRAAQRDGPQWLEGYIGKLADRDAPWSGAPDRAARTTPLDKHEVTVSLAGEEQVGGAAGDGDRFDGVPLVQPFQAVPEPDAAAEQDRYQHDVQVVDEAGG